MHQGCVLADVDKQAARFSQLLMLLWCVSYQVLLAGCGQEKVHGKDQS